MSSTDNNDAAVSQLTAMGFEPAQVQEALKITNGNVDSAVNFLLGGGGAESLSNTNTANESLVLCETSQYNVDNGRSACTCIALMGAALFLESPNVDRINREFLSDTIVQGVAAYQQLPPSSTEHLSAEEVLSNNDIEKFSPLKLQPSGVRQGILSGNSSHPLGLSEILQGCRNECPDNMWMAVLITKPPETIVVLLPPPTTTPQQQYILLDSHPRPFSENHSYARLHSSLGDLVASLQEIFPQTDLGPDVPEIMASMYNSFDVYPLTWNNDEQEE